LFGLMLSGAVIAQQFNNIGVGLIGGGVVGCILGAIVVLIGHAFNVSMSALSAYIHDVRLQYVEYFGKFYTGEGIEFKPFGAEMNYIKFIN
jgi:V/A-type H+/Na+-transporting ATPase subunit I